MKKLDNNNVGEKIRDLWENYEPSFNLEDWIKMQEKLKTAYINRRKTKVINLFKYAAAVFVLCFILTIIWNRLTPPKMITQTTTEGKMEILLSDGTNVWLNRNTKLTYSNKFRGKEREVFLEGEAYFEVFRDSLKNFIVNTTLSEIKVVGTKFNIETFGDDNTETISVIEGNVHVNSEINNLDISLAKNEKLYINKGKNILLKEPISDLNFLSWKTNEIKFVNTPLDRVASILSKHYNIKIILDNNQLKNIKLTATFNNEPLNEVLEIIVLTLNIDFKYEEDQIRLMLND